MLLDLPSLFSMYPGWENLEHQLYLGGILAQFYFSWPIMYCVHALCIHRPRKLSKRLLLQVGEKVSARFAQCRVVCGRLRFGSSKGISSTKNPSERREGIVRYTKLVRESASFMDLCSRMASYFHSACGGKVSLKEMLRIIGTAGMSELSDLLVYKNVRMCRIFVCISSMTFADSAENWDSFRGMSKHVSDTVSKLGLDSFELASLFVRQLRILLSQPAYSINDLTVYICLLKDIRFHD